MASGRSTSNAVDADRGRTVVASYSRTVNPQPSIYDQTSFIKTTYRNNCRSKQTTLNRFFKKNTLLNNNQPSENTAKINSSSLEKTSIANKIPNKRRKCKKIPAKIRFPDDSPSPVKKLLPQLTSIDSPVFLKIVSKPEVVPTKETSLIKSQNSPKKAKKSLSFDNNFEPEDDMSNESILPMLRPQLSCLHSSTPVKNKQFLRNFQLSPTAIDIFDYDEQVQESQHQSISPINEYVPEKQSLMKTPDKISQKVLKPINRTIILSNSSSKSMKSIDQLFEEPKSSFVKEAMNQSVMLLESSCDSIDNNDDSFILKMTRPISSLKSPVEIKDYNTKKQSVRRRMNGFVGSLKVKKYFDALELSPETTKRRINAVIRTRTFASELEHTPPRYWANGFHNDTLYENK